MGRKAGKVNAVVPLYGSKRQMGDTIVDHLGPHTSYLAPFVGSCAVELAKPVARTEILNDLSGNLVNLIRTVARDELAPTLFDRLNRTAFCEDVHRDSVAYIMQSGVPDGEHYPDIERAYHYFVVSWMGRNGLVGTTAELTSGFCVRFTSSGGDPATRFAAAVDSLPWWWKRLRSATVLRRDGIGLIDRFEDRAGAVIYADPPYLEKQQAYTHDFADADHERLAVSLRRFRFTRVVVSYYAHPKLSELYPNWRMVQVGVPKNLSVRGGAQSAPEVLLINQPA